MTEETATSVSLSVTGQRTGYCIAWDPDGGVVVNSIKHLSINALFSWIFKLQDQDPLDVVRDIRDALLKWSDSVEDFIELFYTQAMDRVRIRLEQEDDSWTAMRQKVTDNRTKKDRAKREFENLRQFWTEAQIREVAPSPMTYGFLQRLRQLVEQHKDNRPHVLDLLERAVVARVRNRNGGIRLDPTLMASDIDKARKGDFDDMSQVSDNDLESLGLKRKPNGHGLIQNLAVSSNLTRTSPRSPLASTLSSTSATTIQPLTKTIGEKDSRITLSDTANPTHESGGILTPLVSSSGPSSRADKRRDNLGVAAPSLSNDIEAPSSSSGAGISSNKASASVIGHQNDQDAVTLKTRNGKRRRMDPTFRAPAERKKAAASPPDVEEPDTSTQSTEHLCTDQRSQSLSCKCTLIDRKILISIEAWRKYTLDEAIKLLVSAIDADSATGARVCHAHWCRMASHLGMKANIDGRQMNSFELAPRLRKVHKERNNLDALRAQSPTRYWWQPDARLQRDEIRLNVSRLRSVESVNFMLNEENRHLYLSEEIEQGFKIKGTVIVSAIFEWLLKDAETWFYLKDEVDMYRYHQIPGDDLKRGCWHSLLQQVVRSDPVYYRFTVLLQPDHEHRLIAYPDCMLFAVPGDQNQLRHTKFNIRDLPRGQEVDQISSLISFIDEKEEECGSTPCKAGDARFTLSHPAHGIEGSSLCERITAPPTPLRISRYDAITADNESRGLFEVAEAYRNLTAPRQWVRELSNVHKIILERFPAAAEISQVSAIGEALIGKRSYESPTVIAELQILFGSNKATSDDWIRHNRQAIKKNIKTAYDIVKSTEMKAFGEKSYWFRKMNNMSPASDDDDESVDSLRQYASTFSSHRDLRREHTRSRSESMSSDIPLADLSLLSDLFP